jgi:hypothetical protein
VNAHQRSFGRLCAVANIWQSVVVLRRIKVAMAVLHRGVRMKRAWRVAVVIAGASAFVIWWARRRKAMIFDDVRRTDLARKKFTESTFAYLNRSGRHGSIESRALLESWLSGVPATEHVELCARFRSGKDGQFTSALQELTLHELLRRQGCRVDFHPNLPGASKQPDFVVREPRGSEFILEACTSIKVESGPDRGTRAYRIREFLHSLDLPNHLIAIDELTQGSADLSQKTLRRHINEGIKAGVPGGLDGSISVPLLETPDGWRVEITAYARSKYGDRSTTVMQEAWHRTWDGPTYPLRVALEKNASRYVLLSMPYVVAINSSDVMHFHREFQDTLFGSQPKSAAPGSARDSGFWGNSTVPKHTRVSAVLFTTNLCEPTLLMGQVYACLYLNPWARQPYDGVLANLPAFRFENGEVREQSGQRLHTLLKLRLRDSTLWG